MSVSCRFHRGLAAGWLLLLCGGPAIAGAEHAYSAEAAMVRIDRREADFDTRLAVVGPLPAAGSRITRVSYRWNYANPPAGLAVMLCQLPGNCVDVSDARERQSAAFAGADPARPFYFRARVRGNAAFAPVLGGVAQIIVNWNE